MVSIDCYREADDDRSFCSKGDSRKNIQLFLNLA